MMPFMTKNALRILFLSSSSIALEWQNELIYHTDAPYTVFLGDERVFEGDTNVFSLYGLHPDTEYTLHSDRLDGELTFRTKAESAMYSVTSLGAAGDGVHDDTVALQTAIDALPNGGRLVFPEGTYLTTPLTLKSHITLEFSRGATLLGKTDKASYPVIEGEANDPNGNGTVNLGTWEGNEARMYQSLLYAMFAEDITIIGPGIVDGNAQNGTWWQERKTDPTARPRLFFFNRCNNIHLHGIYARNAASWQLHPYFSTNIDIIDVEVTAPWDSPNTDAIDPESCDRVDIIGCRLSVGDDCIAIKSGKIEIAKRFCTSASRHTIRNCLMECGHGAITLGSEMASGVKQLTVTQCLFRRTDRGLRIKTRRGRGKDAIIDGVLFENLRMEGVRIPIVINMWYNCCDPDRDSEYVWSREHLPVDERTPYLGEFTFRNMVCLDCEMGACYCDGLPEAPIRHITLEDILFTYSPTAKADCPAMRAFIEPFYKRGMYFDNVTELCLRHITIDGARGAPLFAEHVTSITEEDNRYIVT